MGFPFRVFCCFPVCESILVQVLYVQLFSFFISRSRNHIIIKGLKPEAGLVAQRNSPQLLAHLTLVLGAVGISSAFTVVSSITYSAGSSPVFDVELDSPASVDALLRGFYRFTRRSDPAQRPALLSGVSLYHAVTPGTRVRISLLRVIEVFFVCLGFVV